MTHHADPHTRTPPPDPNTTPHTTHPTPADPQARLEILKYHARNKPIEDQRLFVQVAEATAGWSAAALANLMNEAAILTVGGCDGRVGRREELSGGGGRRQGSEWEGGGRGCSEMTRGLAGGVWAQWEGRGRREGG